MALCGSCQALAKKAVWVKEAGKNRLDILQLKPG